MSVENLIEKVMEEFRQIVKTETVVGEPVVAGDSIIVPVSKISFGFGAGGGGQGDEGGRGTGGGATVEPIAFVVVTEGKAQLLTLKEKEPAFRKVMELVPDILVKLKSISAKREKKKDKKKSESGENPEPEEKSK